MLRNNLKGRLQKGDWRPRICNMCDWSLSHGTAEQHAKITMSETYKRCYKIMSRSGLQTLRHSPYVQLRPN